MERKVFRSENSKLGVVRKECADGLSCGVCAGRVVCSVRKGTTLFEAALAAGMRIRTDCGGKGRCGKCLVGAGPAENLSSVTEAEIKVLGEEKIG